MHESLASISRFNISTRKCWHTRGIWNARCPCYYITVILFKNQLEIDSLTTKEESEYKGADEMTHRERWEQGLTGEKALFINVVCKDRKDSDSSGFCGLIWACMPGLRRKKASPCWAFCWTTGGHDADYQPRVRWARKIVIVWDIRKPLI